jgi:hypothetical protein
VIDDPLEVFFGDLFVGEHDFAARIARLRKAAEVHHHFEEINAPFGFAQKVNDARGERIEQEVEVVSDDLFVEEGG